MGTIEVGGDLAVPGRITIGNNCINTADPPIRIHGSITGTGASQPLIFVNNQLNGTIAIDGSLANANTTSPGYEIQVGGTFEFLGAIAINYNGRSDSDNDWASGATIKVGTHAAYDNSTVLGNNTTDRVWNVSRCLGDFNGDRSVNSSDNDAFHDRTLSATNYRIHNPGLEGSTAHHANGNFDVDDVCCTTLELHRTQAAIDAGCDPCLTADPGVDCPGDLDGDWQIDLTDLAGLLGHFGMASGASRADGDMDEDGTWI